jgi:hypothetical protein
MLREARLDQPVKTASDPELVQMRERIDIRLLHHVSTSASSFTTARLRVHPLIVPAHQDLEQAAAPARTRPTISVRQHASDDASDGECPYPLES